MHIRARATHSQRWSYINLFNFFLFFLIWLRITQQKWIEIKISFVACFSWKRKRKKKTWLKSKSSGFGRWIVFGIFSLHKYPRPKKKKEVVQLLIQLWFWIGVHTSYIIDCNYRTSRIYNLLNIVFFNCIRTPEHKKVLFYFI